LLATVKVVSIGMDTSMRKTRAVWTSLPRRDTHRVRAASAAAAAAAVGGEAAGAAADADAMVATEE